MNLLYVAETEAPWGEMAENMRMQHDAFVLQSSSEGYSIESRKSANSFATMLWRKLFGREPKPMKLPTVKNLRTR